MTRVSVTGIGDMALRKGATNKFLQALEDRRAGNPAQLEEATASMAQDEDALTKLKSLQPLYAQLRALDAHLPRLEAESPPSLLTTHQQ